ncbi:MAG: FtsK/SpoIIIE domain-containing protein [Bdellovibrio sp.]
MAENKENAYLKMLSEIKYQELFNALLVPFIGLYYGLRQKLIPFELLFMFSSFLCFTHNTSIDFFGYHYLHLDKIYPESFRGHLKQNIFYFVLPFLIWGFLEGAKRIRFKRRVEETLVTAGLRSVLGKVPEVVGLYPIDQDTQKLILTKVSFALADFNYAKPRIESGLRAYIDDIKENRVKGTVEILFSEMSLPTSVRYKKPSSTACSFFIGATRASEVFGDLDKTPHLLVAGQTGGGKSTFLRNLITTLFLNSSEMKFTLIDLKGGLEFQLFEDLSRVDVIPNLDRAVEELTSLQEELIRRIEFLKKNKVKDIAHLDSKADGATFLKNRRLIVVDEAAEMFLSGGGAESSKIIQARRILSLIARQGRAAGINLVIATQRPDSRSLDTQVKANLTGVLCFPMQNDSSSITVLGNGRATDLPLVPGRAIWKEGPSLIEVQTPYLSVDEADQLLESHRIQKEIHRKATHESHVSKRR